MSLCPSAPCSRGALLIGVVNSRESVVYLDPPVRMDDEARRLVGPRPEERFRFAAPCRMAGCDNWSDGCRLAANAAAGGAAASTVPECGIRPQCRWFAQEGAAACHVCPLVRLPTEKYADGGAGT